MASLILIGIADKYYKIPTNMIKIIWNYLYSYFGVIYSNLTTPILIYDNWSCCFNPADYVDIKSFKNIVLCQIHVFYRDHFC